MAHPLEDETKQQATEATAGPARVLLVDDQPELRRLFRRSLSKAGFEVEEAWDARVAMQLLRASRFDVVISDVRMPDMSGVELLKELFDIDPDLPVVLTSGSPDVSTSSDASAYGAFAFLVKPVPFELMRDTAERAVLLRRARAEARNAFEPYASVERLRVPRGGT